MVHRKTLHGRCVGPRHRQELIAGPRFVGDICRHGSGQLEPAEPSLDGHLPRGRRADEELGVLVFDRGPCTSTQPTIAAFEPEEGVRVEKQLQR